MNLNNKILNLNYKNKKIPLSIFKTKFLLTYLRLNLKKIKKNINFSENKTLKLNHQDILKLETEMFKALLPVIKTFKFKKKILFKILQHQLKIIIGTNKCFFNINKKNIFNLNFLNINSIEFLLLKNFLNDNITKILQLITLNQKKIPYLITRIKIFLWKLLLNKIFKKILKQLQKNNFKFYIHNLNDKKLSEILTTL